MKKYLLLFVGVIISVSANAEDSLLREDINKLKEDLVVVQRQLYRDKADTTAPQESVSNIQVKLGEYDQFIRDINGKVENIEFRLSQLEKKIETFDKDIELRFEQFKRSVGNVDTKNAKEVKQTPTKPTNKPKVTSNLSAKDLYESALKDLKVGKNKDAENKFLEFLGAYPTDQLAGNAQYWLGEVYYKQQDFKKAAVAFKEGYSKFPNGAKGPDCLLKLGLTMKALNKKEDACTAFVNLPVVFDKVSDDISSRAKKEAEALGCK